MNFQQLGITIIEAKSKEFPNRQFHLKKKLENSNEGGIFIANSQGWNDNSKEFMLKIQKEMKEDQKCFIAQLIEYQRNYENGTDQHQLPTNILKLYDFFQWQSNHCIVMENGQQSLLEYIDLNKAVSLKEKLRVLIQITLPILYLHKARLIHRNIKSENFMKVENVFKLIDFGLVKDSNPFNIKTMQIGTLIFSAPEMIQNSNKYTDKIDIWSLACVFYEILSAQPLFDGQSYQEITSQILNHNQSPNEVNNKISQLNTSETIKALLVNMLAYEEAKRPTIEQVYEKLTQEDTISLPNQQFPNRKFQIINQLEKGTQCQVYLVKSTNWGINDQKQFALKQQANFNDNELQTINMIINNQKNQFNQASQIIKIYEICQQNNKVYLIMETGEQDLYQYIEQQQQQLSLEQKIKIMKQLSQSIYFFHETLKLIHRDIKPENFIKVGDEFKLIDFGLAKTTQELQLKQNVGTPYFQAPEIVQNRQDYTCAVDIWSLGCVFYELCKSQPLFQANTIQKIQNIILNFNQKYLEDKLNQDLMPQSLKNLLIQMIQPNPKDRLSIKEVVSKLNQIQTEQFGNQNNNFIVQNTIQNNNQQFQQQNNFPQIYQQFNPQIQQQKQQQQLKDQDQKQIQQTTLIQLEKQDQQDKYYQRITEQISLFQNQFVTALNDLKNEFKDQNNQYLKAQNNNDNITKLIQEHQLNIKDKDIQIKELNQSISEFKTKISEQNSQIQKLKLDINTYQSKIKDQKDQLKNLNQIILDSKQKKELVIQENQKLIQLQQTIVTERKQIKQNIQNQQEYNEYPKKIDELQQINNQLKYRIQQYEDHLNFKNKLIDAVKNEIPQLLECAKKHPNQPLTLNQHTIKQNINALTDSISKDIYQIISIIDETRTQIRNLIQETKKYSMSLEKCLLMNQKTLEPNLNYQ